MLEIEIDRIGRSLIENKKLVESKAFLLDCKEEVLSYPYETDLLVTFPESPRNSIAFTIEKCQEDTSG